MFSEEELESLELDNGFEKSSVSILINRKGTSVSSSYEVGMAVCIPIKRTSGFGDKVRWRLQYYSFLDDKRSLNNIDSILNRLVELEVVHICCTENALVSFYLLEHTCIDSIFRQERMVMKQHNEKVKKYQPSSKKWESW